MSRRTIGPHRLLGAPHRPSAFAVTLLGLGILPALLSSCRTAPSPTFPPITAPSPRPSATSEPSATPKPRPTRTGMPTVDPAVPLPVAMTLDEARAEVWSWLDPGHAPRIVSVDYIPGAAVAAYRINAGEWHVFDSFGGRNVDRLLEGNRMPPTLVRVVAECAPLDAPLLDEPLGFYDGQTRFLGRDMARLLVLFDATTGTRLAAQAMGPRDDDVVHSALVAPTAALLLAATKIPPTATTDRPTWTPEPTATKVPTPVGATIDADHVPPPMRDVFAEYPLLPGNSWTWESTSWEGGVSWYRSRMTETVVGAWRIDDARAVVHSLVERRREFGPPLDGFGMSNSDSARWRLVNKNGGVVSYTDPPGADHDLITERNASELARLRLPLEALVFPHLKDYWSWPERTATKRISVTTPAGRFAGCGAFNVIGGSAWASVRAICPGIGYVETDSWHAGMLGSGRTVTTLVAYHVVLPR